MELAHLAVRDNSLIGKIPWLSREVFLFSPRHSDQSGRALAEGNLQDVESNVPKNSDMVISGALTGMQSDVPHELWILSDTQA